MRTHHPLLLFLFNNFFLSRIPSNVVAAAFNSAPHNNNNNNNNNKAFVTKIYPTASTSQRYHRHHQHPVIHAKSSSSPENKNDEEYIPNRRPPPPGGDMAYIRRNIARQAEIYNKIRQAGGLECVNDVYARDPKQEEFWFVGKVSRCTGTVSLNECISRQFNLMEEHATRVRPIELGRSIGKIEIWTAPGDSEFQMSQNDPNIVLTKMKRYVEGCEDISCKEVGYVAEVVTNQGEGFRVVRNGNDGTVPPYLIGEG